MARVPETGKEPSELTDEEVDAIEDSLQIQALLDHENYLWKKEQMDPQNVQQNLFLLSRQVHAIINFLLKKGLVDEAELNLFFRKELFKELRKIREEVAPQVRKARIAGGLNNKIFGPKGDGFLN